MGDLPKLIRTERAELIDLLTELGPAEWAVPSLCGEWTVQEVAAHLAWAPVAPLGVTVRGLVGNGFRINRASAELAKRWATRGTDAILTQLRFNAETGVGPTGVPQPAVLVDAVVHQIDIRRPLDRPRPVPPAAFRVVADAGTTMRWPMTVMVGGSARRRLAGVRLVADGYDWSWGDGPEVRASGECVLRLLNGRPVDRDELAGPGADQLFVRLNPERPPRSRP